MNNVQNEHIYYVYKYTRKDYNTCFYVGKGKGYRYSQINYGRSKYFKDIISVTEYDVEFVEKGLSEQEAFILEKQVISELIEHEGYTMQCDGDKPHNIPKHLVNRTLGGGPTSAGYKQSSEIVANRVAKNTGQKRNPAQRKRMSEARKLAIKEDPSIIRKLMEGKARNPVSDKTRAKISLSRVGQRLSDECKLKRYDKWCNSYYGSRTDEQIEAINSSRRKALGRGIKCIDLGIDFDSLRQCCSCMLRDYGINLNRHTLVKFCEGRYNNEWYGEVIKDGKPIRLHWVYCTYND